MFETLGRYYYKFEMPKVRKKITEFKEEIGNRGKCRRLIFLYDRLFEFDLELINRKRIYQRSFEQSRPYIGRALIASYIPEIEAQIKKIESEIKFIVRKPKNGSITPEMITMAREYPMENLIQVRKGMALCPFHSDKKPSLSIRDNFFHCFGCGVKGDVIDFVMKRHSLSFKDAVERLSYEEWNY